jgi:predicted RNA-binding protein with PIN domain
MGVLIDGFNLIYKFPQLEELMYRERLNDARKGLQEILKEYHSIRPTEIRLIYDGKKNMGDMTRQESAGPLKIYYSHDLSADHMIKEFVKHDPNPRMTTVVSSDKEIIFYVRRFNAQIVKSEDFAVQVIETIEKARTVQRPEKEDNPMLSDDEISYWEKMFRK